MNHIKLQQDILKAKDAEDKRGKRSPFMYGLKENSVYICVNRCCIVVIPFLGFLHIFRKVCLSYKCFEWARFGKKQKKELSFIFGLMCDAKYIDKREQETGPSDYTMTVEIFGKNWEL